MRFISLLTAVTSLVTVTLAFNPVKEELDFVFQSMVSTAADKVIPAAKDINVVNARLATVGEGPYPVVAWGLDEFRAQCDTIVEIVEDILAPPSIFLNRDESDAVAGAYDRAASFVLDVIDTLNEKASVIDSLVSVGGQIGPRLEGLRRVVADMAHGLVEIVELSSVDPINHTSDAFIAALDIAITKYTPLVDL